MRTAFFVDGYNLYYGALHASPYKWLDLPALLKSILQIQVPDATVASIAYYTSPVIARLATRGQASNEAQSRYIRALQARGVTVTLGSHRLAPGYAPRYVNDQKASRQDQVKIWQLEEKQTDVNVALGMYRTASRAEQLGLEQIVLVSGDTDLAPALALIRQDFPQLQLGVILPHRGERSEIVREPPGSLQKHCDWMRRYLSEEELKSCQLPPKVPLPRKPAIVKPAYW
ncbi:6-hydroxy-3-succinoylpyridine 3-monooxygenase HspA [compost metagenome]